MPELDDLETLADDVRASAPRPREQFVARLDKRVEAGFPKQRAKKDAGWFWRPTLALAACALLTLVVAVGVLSGNGEDQASTDASSGGGAAAPAIAPERPELDRELNPARARGENETDLLRASPTPRSAVGNYTSRADEALRPFAAGNRRVVERRTTLELETDGDEFAEATAGVLRVADATGTIVQRSNVAEADGRGLATYDLRVPASRLDEVLRDLSELGEVTSRAASSDDITASFVSAADRLQDARDERRALLRALGRADSENAADALRARIGLARARIARAERDVRRVRARADRARVAVIVRSTGALSDGGAWTPGDALDDAGRVLEVSAGVAVITGAVLLPFALLAGLWAAGARVTRRRRREAALG